MKAIKKLFSFFWDKSLLLFAIVGAVNTVLSMTGSFFLVNYAGWHSFWAMAFMFAVLSIGSFYFNRKYSFQSKEPLLSSAVRFSVVVTVCFLLSYGLNYLVLPWMRDQWFPNIPPLLYSAVLILGVQVVFTLLNYLGQRLWAFKKPAPTEESVGSTK